MKSTVIFFIIIYVASLAGGAYLYLQNKESGSSIVQELATTKSALASSQSALDTSEASQVALKNKIAEASVNAKFLALALCPTLEVTDINALCVKDNTEWFSQTMLSGTMIIDPNTKAKMDALLVALGAKAKPTAKQLYEMLKPIEVDSLKALTESLK